MKALMRKKNQSNSNKNQMPGSSQSGSSNYKSNKGTGMSSEAGSNQNEESWQDTSGSRPVSSQRNENENQSSKGSGNMSNTGVSNRNMGNTLDAGLTGNKSDSGNLNTDNIKNQSDQQRRASIGDDTPEEDEKDLENTNLANEELNDVDWNTGNSKK